MALRDNILDEVLSRLKGISIANGFSIDVKLAEVDLLKFPEKCTASQIPYLSIIDGTERKDDSSVTQLDNSLEIEVTGYVKDNRNPQPKRRLLQEAVEIALTNDPGTPAGSPNHELGGGLKIINFLPSEVITDKGSMFPYSIFQYTFTAIYLQEYGTP